jgi:hypothetical protein
MLKVSEDGRQLLTGDGIHAAAEWEGLFLRLPKGSCGLWRLEDAKCLSAFIQAGPPKKQWRITRTFGKKPCVVSTDGDPTFVYSLCDSDIEEV